MIFICTDEGEWSVKVNIVNEIAYFCIHCCLKIGKTIPIYSENNITQCIREIIKKRGELSSFQSMGKNIIDQTKKICSRNNKHFCRGGATILSGLNNELFDIYQIASC